MKKPYLYFHACLAGLLMLAAAPAKAVEVKELFRGEGTVRNRSSGPPRTEGRMIEMSYPPAHKTWSIGMTPMRSATCSSARSSCS